MEWIEVESSNVGRIARDDKTGDIYVQFLDGSIYKYPSATKEHWDSFLSAPSKGRYVHGTLQNSCGYVRVAGPIRKSNRR